MIYKLKERVMSGENLNKEDVRLALLSDDLIRGGAGNANFLVDRDPLLVSGIRVVRFESVQALELHARSVAARHHRERSRTFFVGPHLLAFITCRKLNLVLIQRTV